MAETEQKQVPVNTENKPVKKRRFFRPRPKVKAEPQQDNGSTIQPTAKPKNELKPKNNNKTDNSVAARQTQQKPKARVENNSERVATPNKPKPANQRKEKPVSEAKQATQAKASQQKPKPTNNSGSPAQPQQEKPHKQQKPKQSVKAEQAVQPKQATPRNEHKPTPKQKPSTPAPIKPATQTAHKTTNKINSNFKPKRNSNLPKLHLSDIDFKYLDVPEFRDIYALVTKAQSYFATDKETCCAKFRIANEAIIERLIKDLQLTETVEKKEWQTNYFEQINLLQKETPEDMIEGNIFAEMHNIRMIGNSFAHGDDKYDASKGSKTCLIAMEKIC